MTKKEFDNMKWKKGIEIINANKNHIIVGVNFGNSTVTIQNKRKIVAIPYYNLELKKK